VVKHHIKANQVWNAGSKQLLSLKTPTCILLKKNKEFVSFGYEAENEYAGIVTDHEEKDYQIKRFGLVQSGHHHFIEM
jgi:hypothetical protein